MHPADLRCPAPRPVRPASDSRGGWSKCTRSGLRGASDAADMLSPSTPPTSPPDLSTSELRGVLQRDPRV